MASVNKLFRCVSPPLPSSWSQTFQPIRTEKFRQVYQVSELVANLTSTSWLDSTRAKISDTKTVKTTASSIIIAVEIALSISYNYTLTSLR